MTPERRAELRLMMSDPLPAYFDSVTNVTTGELEALLAADEALEKVRAVAGKLDLMEPGRFHDEANEAIDELLEILKYERATLPSTS